MRIWSLHPKYLDAKGLVALWRETLLAQHVLLGLTKGYTQHPQLLRFKEQAAPVDAIGEYLWHVHSEAQARGYNFDKNKIRGRTKKKTPMAVNDGQLAFELAHLKRKLRTRDPKTYRTIKDVDKPETHPLFTPVCGPVAAWERP